MRRFLAVYRWDLLQGVRNRFLQLFAVAALVGGAVVVVSSPGPETLPLLLLQALLFFGSLFGFLSGWGSGQEARAQGGFLMAQPLSTLELVLGKLLGTGTWCVVLLLLFMGPAALQAGMAGTVLALTALALGYVLLCVAGGLLIGLLAAPVSGLLTVLTAWVVTVAGWELGLLMLSEAGWIQDSPGLFVTLLLINPAGAFRIGAMVGLEAIPFDATDLETGRVVFENIEAVAGGIFALWLAALSAAAAWALGRQEF